MCSDQRRRAPVIVFLGPDGAGKSTVVAKVQDGLSARGLSSRTYYFAPGFLRRYRPTATRTVTSDPHGGVQYKAPLVLAKVLLMLFEFNLGLYKVRRSHEIALFDRYIHDLLVDPIRYRMERVRWWMRLLLALAPVPDLFVVITSPAEVIHQRKQEVSFSETCRQLDAYQRLVTRFPQTLLVENTGTPDEAAASVLARILHR
jgi:thymidylate kinase